MRSSNGSDLGFWGRPLAESITGNDTSNRAKVQVHSLQLLTRPSLRAGVHFRLGGISAHSRCESK